MSSSTTIGAASQARTDIQVLRGFAVLIVLLYHAKMSFLPAGYLGVDVFFVISGFLITGLIRKGIERGDFSFATFYFRRAKRLLPAAYVTFLACALLAPFFLTDAEMKDFRAQMVGAVTFTANMVLWRQSGYFEGASELKPLLHVWSLAIEEQYYFILPALMAFVPRRFWLAMALTALAVSGALCWLLADRPSAQFFLLPTRAWELMIGSVGALVAIGPRGQKALKALFWPALIVLLALPCLKFGRHPGPQALAICIATLLVLLRHHPVLESGWPMRAMSKLGDMSYSLYLVHWPLFAFFHNAWIGEVARDQPLSIRLSLVMLALALGWLLHRGVEEPIRHANIERSRRMLLRTVTGSIGLVLVTAGIAHAVTNARDYAHIKRPNHGFGQQCEYQRPFESLAECRNSPNPQVLVWGDSFAMHLVPGIAATTGVMQATRSVCAPLRGMALVLGGVDDSWARRCIEFNESVLESLKKQESVKTVVLSSIFYQQVQPGEWMLRRDLERGSDERVASSVPATIEGLRRTADAVRAMGKRVIVIAPPPSAGFDIGRCIERIERKLFTLGAGHDCQVREAAYHAERRHVLALLDELPRHGIDLIRFEDLLCRDGACRTRMDGVMLYRDSGHLSHDGSVHLARTMRWHERLQIAR